MKTDLKKVFVQIFKIWWLYGGLKEVFVTKTEIIKIAIIYPLCGLNVATARYMRLAITRKYLATMKIV